MLNFLKRLAKAIYDATIGGVVRLVQHTQEAKIDDKDKRCLGRLLVYTGFAVFAWFFPQFALLVGMLRFMMTADVLDTIATIYQSTVNAYA